MRRYEPEYLKATKNHSEQCTLIAMEECGELIQAISKAKRGKLDKDKLTEYCKENDLSMSQVIRKAIKNFID